MIELLQPEIQRFIDDHLNDQPANLMLKASQFSDWPMKTIVEQITAKRKAKSKLPEWFSTENIIYPSVLSMEQCSSQKAAEYKASLVSGESMVDLTGGFGVDTYYLSKGFNETVHVEMNDWLSSIVSHNYSVLRSNIKTINISAEDFLAAMEPVDLIYIDPARRDNSDRKVVFLEDYSPNVLELMPKLIAKSKQILIKVSPMLDIKKAVADLGHVEEVHVLALNNEVKELLFLIRDKNSIMPLIKTLNLNNEASEIFTFNFLEEDSASTDYSEVLTFLYEPNASIMKAGAFKTIAKRFPLKKLHANTHLYTSDLPIADFPGRTFKVLSEISLNKKKLKKQFDEDQANITTRNFPMSVKEIRSKTGLKEGGIAYIFATTDVSSKKLLLCEKV